MSMGRGETLDHVRGMITRDRNATHGEPQEQFDCAQAIKEAVNHNSAEHLLPAEREAIDMICTKLSRLAKGSPILDHWHDIIGYAAIAAEARGRV